MQAIAIIGLAFGLLVAVFAVQNSTPVTVTFVRWRLVDVSLALVILGSAAGGALVVGLFGAVRQIGLHFGMRTLRQRVERLAAELEASNQRVAASERQLSLLQAERRTATEALGAARRRAEELEVELEATRSMELLPVEQQRGDEAEES